MLNVETNGDIVVFHSNFTYFQLFSVFSSQILVKCYFFYFRFNDSSSGVKNAVACCVFFAGEKKFHGRSSFVFSEFNYQCGWEAKIKIKNERANQLNSYACLFENVPIFSLLF